MDKGFQQVVTRFPHQERRIRELEQKSEPFCELCADYKECLEALERYKKREAGERIEEYAELLAGLDRELVRSLAGVQSGGEE